MDYSFTRKVGGGGEQVEEEGEKLDTILTEAFVRRK
jgi:hypothetical protein